MDRARGATAESASATITDDWCRHHFDHLSPELAAALPETMARMRSLCPVAHSDRYDGFWVVTGYEDVLAVAQDWETFSSAHGLTVPPSPIAVRNLPVEIDPPLHRVFKRLINAYFTPAAVAPREDRTRDLVNRLLDAFVEKGHCDFMAEFARPYPALSFFESAINAPSGDVERVAYLASKSGTPNDPDAAACWMGLSEWINEFIEQRRRGERKGDVVDAVIEAEIEGRPITQEEIIGTVQLLILGGLETTAGALGSMMIRFCAEPDIPEVLRRDPGLIPHAVEELLRLDGPFISITRTVDARHRDRRSPDQGGRKGHHLLGREPTGTAPSSPDPTDFDLDREQQPPSGLRRRSPPLRRLQPGPPQPAGRPGGAHSAASTT